MSDPPPKLPIQFRSPTVGDLEGGTFSPSSSPRASPILTGRRGSVKDMIGNWEMNSMASNSDAGGSHKSYRSLRSEGTSFAKKFERRELFNLVLHIPMPDGEIEDYELAIDREYNCTQIAKAVCFKHQLNYDIMGI